MWDCILSILVIVHLLTEYVHYTLEYIWGKREGNVLLDIQKHRKASQKTAALARLQKDVDLIKEKLGIKDDS